MLFRSTEAFLRDLHGSLTFQFGTTAPYMVGAVRAEKIGFAQIPCVVVDVYVRDEDLPSLIPITRQRVFGELAERGWANETIAFVPSVQRGRRRKFVDENEGSTSSLGRNKFGRQHRVSFEMVDRELVQATFVGFGSFARLPEREEE